MASKGSRISSLRGSSYWTKGSNTTLRPSEPKVLRVWTTVSDWAGMCDIANHCNIVQQCRQTTDREEVGGRNNNAVECKPAIMAINCGWLEACGRPNGRVAWGWRMRSRSITIIVVIVILLVYNHWWRCVMINLRIWWSAERDEKEKEEEEVRTRWSI